MTTQEMMRSTHKPGYWFVNVAPMGDRPDWQEQIVPHESKLLFGYEPKELMAKQYRVG